MSISSHFEIVDYIYDFKTTHKKQSESSESEPEKNHIIVQFNERILYNLRTVIHLIFDHDQQILAHN